jgi:hypothetical protein
MLTFFTLADFANSIFFHTFAFTLKMVVATHVKLLLIGSWPKRNKPPCGWSVTQSSLNFLTHNHYI